MIAVAVPAVVPPDDAPARVGEQRCEHIVGAGEVEAAVRDEQRRRGLVTPLVDRDAQAVGQDVAAAIGPPRTGEGLLHEGATLLGRQQRGQPAKVGKTVTDVMDARHLDTPGRTMVQ